MTTVHATDKKLRIHFIFFNLRRLVFFYPEILHVSDFYSKYTLVFEISVFWKLFRFQTRTDYTNQIFGALKIDFKKNCLKFQLLDILNWICKEKFVTSWWKFENELWSYISFNGECSENDQKVFYFGILVRKNSIFHDKFNHLFHFSVWWLFPKILQLFHSF